MRRTSLGSGVMFMLIANVLPRLQPNWWVGFVHLGLYPAMRVGTNRKIHDIGAVAVPVLFTQNPCCFEGFSR